jgi:hypothetical protein
MKRARGKIDSGIPDLASNPRHLSGFGRKEKGSARAFEILANLPDDFLPNGRGDAPAQKRPRN